ncbi:MAG: trehalose-phosphatase [Candidatus Omnitrophota bacterium]|jgi:trehalose-phosphatase
MRHLDIHRQGLRALIAGGPLYIFLDYDGTLVPFSGRPQDTRTPAGTALLLRRLSSLPGCRVAVVSGRALADVKKRVGVNGLIYVGNHGYEIAIPGKKAVSYVPAGYRPVLSGIKKDILSGVGRIKGVVLEDKGISLAVHFRLATAEGAKRAVKVFYGAVTSAVLKGAVAVKKGKKVLEILPAGKRDKGTAVAWLLSGAVSGNLPGKQVVFYFGDDKTDEDAFRELKGKGITVCVGRKRGSQAEYYLSSPPETVSFLRELSALREEKICRN